MKATDNIYAGYTASEAAFLAACSVILVIFLFTLIFALWIVRTAKKHPRAGHLAGRMMGAQFRFYGRQFKSGYTKERSKNFGVGLLALSLPMVTAEEVNESFSNGLFTIFKGAWDILAPYVGAVFVLWIITLIVQRVHGSKSRR